MLYGGNSGNSGGVYTDQASSPYVVDNTYANYVQQYAGAPIGEMYSTALKLDETYKQNKLAQDQLETLINNLEVRDVNSPYVRASLDKTKGNLNDIRESGRWEDASWLVQQASYDFANDKNVQGALKDKQMYDADVANMQKRLAEKKITEEDFKNWSIFSKNKNTKPIGYDPNTGAYSNMWNSDNVPDYIDYANEARTFLKDANANQLADAGLTSANGGYYKAGTREFITHDEALDMALGYIKQRPDVQSRIQWDKKSNDLGSRGQMDANGNLLVDANGNPVLRDVTLAEVAGNNGLTVGEDGNLGYYEYSPKYKKKVWVPADDFNGIIYSNGELDQKSTNALYDAMWGQNYLKRAVDPAAQWLDFEKEKYDFHRNWMLEKSIDFENAKKLKEIDDPNPYLHDIMSIPRGGYGQLNPNSSKAFLQDGKINGNELYLTFGENSPLANAGFGEKDLDKIIKVRTDINNALKKYGSFWDYRIKFDKEEGATSVAANWFAQINTVPDWLKQVPGYVEDKVDPNKIKELQSAKNDINTILSNYGYNMDGYINQLNNLEKLDKNQQKVLELYATTMDGLGTVDGEVQGMYNGVDGNKMLDVNGKAQYDQLKNMGWDKDKIKTFNDLVGKEVFRFSPGVKVPTEDGKSTTMDMFEFNLYKPYQITSMDVMKYNNEAGDKTLSNKDLNDVGSMEYSDYVQTVNSQSKLDLADHTYVVGTLNNLNKSYGNYYTNTNNGSQKNSDLISSSINDLQVIYEAYRNNPTDQNLRSNYFQAVMQLDTDMQTLTGTNGSYFGQVTSKYKQ